MLNSVVLDVGIGLAFVYLLLGLLCTGAHEWIAGVLALRAKTLEEGLAQMLGGADAAKRMLDHPLVRSVSPKDGRPSYLSARIFGLALMDTVRTAAQVGNSLEEFRGAVSRPDSPGAPVRALLQSADLDLAGAQREIEDWFDQAMDRVSGGYKRWTQLRMLALAAVITFVANADTLEIARTLWQNPTLRAQIVEAAVARQKEEKPLAIADYPHPDEPVPSPAPTVKSPTAEDRSAVYLSDQESALLSELTGWSTDFRAFRAMASGKPPGPGFPSASDRKLYDGAFPGWSLWDWLTFKWLLLWVLPKRLVGWLVTLTAVSLGAPFWFDGLKSLINLRAAGKPPAKQADAR